ncbi:SDR family NAD(P)-dependent oxidoreductase [Solibacillus sp. FSL H8-0538]|uniref:SDR family NAD(P)-dependent oxidoreductase n=1 Tax=Solibacillus sp. FSL H8-0538 TaxID=2921400 RepID=UPI0030FCCE64
MTGAAHGIGKGIAKAYAEADAHVVLADVQENKGKILVNELLTVGYSAFFIKTDVRIEEYDLAFFLNDILTLRPK